MKSTLVMVLAGGKGRRLVPLTIHRAKPAVPFGGRYRIIDFVLSNIYNSGYRRIYVLTQYMASSLIRHLNRTWHIANPGEFLEVVPAQMRGGSHWYRGTADSVWQNEHLIENAHAENVAIFGGDHIYKFDISQMEALHRARRADLTIAAYRIPRAAAGAFGVFEVDEDGRLLGFEEKPADPKPMPGLPDVSLVSMGNYFFRSEALQAALDEEIREPDAQHDFGKSVIPRMLRNGFNVAIYDFASNRIEGEPEGEQAYWRDVGTLDGYFDANLDLRDPLPQFNLYNFRWRIRTAQRNYPPSRFVASNSAQQHRAVVDCLVCEGTIVHNAEMNRTVAGYDCYFHSGSSVRDSVILSGCDIGADCRLSGVLLDKNCSVAPGTVIGDDPAADAARFPFVTPAGRVVFPKGTHVPREGPLELAHDIESLLAHDPTTRELMREYKDRYRVADRSRHSHDSVGPRFRRFGTRLEE